MIAQTESQLQVLLAKPPFEAYTYAYPHKQAYRPLPNPVLLREAWRRECRDALFLYLHVPFCEMRCGFCNLFTAANPSEDLVGYYLSALKRQAAQVRAALGEAGFARLAVGGGTPTFLDAGELEVLFDVVEGMTGKATNNLPFSVETSPATATRDRLALLRSKGVDRISIGVQSFIESETAAVGRHQKRREVEAALGAIRAANFPTLNVDLIYGLPGQTMATWLESVSAALMWRPEEIFLYPLYVRPLTGLGKKGRQWADLRLEFYREARAALITQGYTQISMRMFRAAHAPVNDGPAYCTQDDGMVGLGCGARSYTRELHYAMPYAVGAIGVREIINSYACQTQEDFGYASHGYILDEAEQKRRYVAQTLLNCAGVPIGEYERRFNSGLFEDLPELLELELLGFAKSDADHLRLTPAGLERSDTLGPWLYSERVRELMRTAALA